jgi:monoamine oxidase
MMVDVVVIGAGVAGLSAAAAVRAGGLSCILIEATNRIGGRARTVAVGGASFDAGASWLHNAERNPLTDLARTHGERLIASGGARDRRRYIGARPACASERDDFDATWEAFTEIATDRALSGPDISVAAAIAPLRTRPWTATVEYWEASLIAAADPKRLSVRDWHANLLDGENLEVAGGIGAFVERRLGPAAGEIRRDTPATAIAWDAGRVSVQTPAGQIDAHACIVTVSTGVLAAERIRFDPPLPSVTRDAIAGLPMGLLSKVAFPARRSDRLGLPDSTSLQRRLDPGDEAVVSFFCWPFGRPHVVAFVGGPKAWSLAAEGDGAIEHFARAELAKMLGHDAAGGLGPGVRTEWATDPAYLGAYAYAGVGHAAARGILGTPLADGHLVFAGEAVCTDGLAGTVGGACLSGRRAAATVAEALTARVA